MKFQHAEWRKLYREEQGEFARLPWLARAAAAELLKPCDDAGRIHIGELQPKETVASALVRVVAFRMGATRSDRRIMKGLFEALFTECYLVHRGPYVCIRTFVAAQSRRDVEPSDSTPSEAPRKASAKPSPPAPKPVLAVVQTVVPPSREGATTVPLADHLPTTSEPLADHLPTTAGDVSTRKHSDDDASARARARSSVPSSSVPGVPTPDPEGGGGNRSWEVQNRVRTRSLERIDERVQGEREKALVAVGQRFGWDRLMADLDAICDCAAIDAGFAHLKAQAEADRRKFVPSLGAWLGKAEADYPADALFSQARTAREWLKEHAAPRAKAFTAPKDTAPIVSLAVMAGWRGALRQQQPKQQELPAAVESK